MNTPNKMETRPNISYRNKDSFKIKAEEITPITGIPKDPTEVLIAGMPEEIVM